MAQVYDTALNPLHRTPLPAAERGSHLAIRADIIAVTCTNTVTVVDRGGGVRWQSDIVGESQPADCHLDTHGILWLHLADAHEIRALDATGGGEISRIAVPPGGGWFVAHRQGEWPALNIAVCPPEDVQCWVPELHDGRIALRRLADGGGVFGFTSDRCLVNGGRHVTSRSLNSPATKSHEISDIVGSGRLARFPQFEQAADRDWLCEAAAVIGEGLALVAVVVDSGDHEEHLLLSAAGLRYLTRMDYPHPMRQNSIYPSTTAGRWLTRDHDSGLLELWELDGPVTDEVPGQLVLWHVDAQTALSGD